MSAPGMDDLHYDLERVAEAVRREVNLVDHGVITASEACLTLLAGDLRLIEAEDLTVRRETADMDERLARILGGAA